MVGDPASYGLKIREDDIELDWLEAKGMIDRGEAILIDLRKKEDFEKDPIEGAINLDNVDDIFLYKFRFEEDKKYIFIDYLGETAKVIAQYLRGRGIKAYAVKGGVRSLKME